MRQAAWAAVLCLPTLAHGQTDLTSNLSTALAPVAGVENLGATLTCTALYRSLSLLFGSESENFDEFRSGEGAMASLSGVLWAQSPGGQGQSPDEVFTVLLPLIDTATDQILARMDALSLIDGTPFDDEILGQIDFCDAILESLVPRED